MNEDKILNAINGLGDRIDNIDKNLNDFKEETNARFGNLDKRIDSIDKNLNDFKEETNTRLDNFEEETRENFVSMSKMIRNTNERVTELDKKMDKKFDDMNYAMGKVANSIISSVERQIREIKEVVGIEKF